MRPRPAGSSGWSRGSLRRRAGHPAWRHARRRGLTLHRGLQADTSDDSAVDEDELAVPCPPTLIPRLQHAPTPKVVMLKLARAMGEPLSESEQELHLAAIADTVEHFGTAGSLSFREFANMLCHSAWRRILSPEVQAAIGPLAMEMFEQP